MEKLARRRRCRRYCCCFVRFGCLIHRTEARTALRGKTGFSSHFPTGGIVCAGDQPMPRQTPPTHCDHRPLFEEGEDAKTVGGRAETKLDQTVRAGSVPLGPGGGGRKSSRGLPPLRLAQLASTAHYTRELQNANSAHATAGLCLWLAFSQKYYICPQFKQCRRRI